MGGLLSLRRSDGLINTDIFVNFEKAQPTPEEETDYAAIDAVMSQSNALLDKIRNYTGQGALISKAISAPSKENELAAWEAVVPQVGILKEFYDFSLEIGKILPTLLTALCTGDPNKNLENKQAIAKQFAELLYFVLMFDDLKMTTPSIQNDFSYYRRSLSRMKMSDEGGMQDLVVKDELANKLSLFYAAPTPMLNAVVDSTTEFVNDDKVPSDNVTECLATMAAVCHNAVHNPVLAHKFEKPETLIFCLRVMVGVIILYDHISVQGAFHKGSSINIKSSIKLIQTHGKENADGLLNALRYTTKHLNDEDTPKGVKALLA